MQRNQNGHFLFSSAAWKKDDDDDDLETTEKKKKRSAHLFFTVDAEVITKYKQGCGDGGGLSWVRSALDF